MIGQPFRSAFWVMVLGLGLCVCLLIAEPRRSILPPLRLTTLNPAGNSNAGAANEGSTEAGVVVQSTSAVETLPAPERTAAADDVPVAIDVTDAVPPPPPLREVIEISPERHELPVVEATDRTPAAGRFEELPPPPIVIETVDGPASAWEAPNPAVLAEFDQLRSQVRELTDAVREIRELQSTVGSSIESLVARAAEPKTPEVLDCEAHVFYLPAPSAARLDWRRDVGLESDVSEVARTRCGGSSLPPEQVVARLIEVGAVGIRRQRFEMDRQAPVRIDLSGRLAPRIVESRGGVLSERMSEAPWVGQVAITWDALDAQRMLVSLRGDNATDPALSEWQQLATAPRRAIVLAGAISAFDPNRSVIDRRNGGQIVLVLTLTAATDHQLGGF